MVIDHIGIVVRSIKEGVERWGELFGYEQRTSVVVNTRQSVRVVFLEKQGSQTVKLIEPLGPASPVWLFSRRGGGLHHVCFRCDRLETGIAHLKQHGARLLVEPAPGEAFNNHEIAFLLVEPALNVELIDTVEKVWSTAPVRDE